MALYTINPITIGVDQASGRDETVIAFVLKRELVAKLEKLVYDGETLEIACERIVREAASLGSPEEIAWRKAAYEKTVVEQREEIERLRAQLADEKKSGDVLAGELNKERERTRELRAKLAGDRDPKSSPVAAARKALKRANEALISGGDLEKNFIRPDGSIDHEKLQAHIRADQIERGKKTLELLKEARRLIDALPDSRAKSRPSLDALYRDLESTAKAFVSQKFDDWRRAAGAREAPRAHAVRSVSFDPAVFGALFEFGSPSTLEAARRRYRELAKSAHPDRGGSHERMVALNKAFEVLERHFGGTSV